VKGGIHILITAPINRRSAAGKKKTTSAYKFRQAAQLRGLEVVHFPVEAHPSVLRRFLLSKGIFVQLTEIRLELDTKKGKKVRSNKRLDGSKVGLNQGLWRT